MRHGGAMPSVLQVPSELLAVTYDARDSVRVAAFWAALLGRDTVGVPGGVLLVGEGGQAPLEFVGAESEKAGPGRYHLHVTSDGARAQEQVVADALGLGARHLDVGQLPDEDHVVLSDPEGNEFCVIEQANGFLAGCGVLGEVSGDGTRAVGLFWHHALGWPLVWDHDEETAVQSPQGGTKISWGGPPVAPKVGRNRQRLHLAASDLGAEVERLRALGATEIGPSSRGVELADPDGNEFLLTPR